MRPKIWYYPALAEAIEWAMVQNVLDLDVQNSFLILQVEMIPATSPGSSEKGPHTSSMGASSNQGSISSGSSVHVHFKIKPHKCERPDCGKGFSRLADLKRHQDICGVTVGKYACDICGKQFTSIRYLKRHSQNEHSALQSCRFWAI